VKEKIRLCTICFNITDTDPCLVCADLDRDPSSLCVVEEPPQPRRHREVGDVPRALSHPARLDRSPARHRAG
jgi:hypothetical protein